MVKIIIRTILKLDRIRIIKLNDTLFLKLLYRLRIGKKLDLKNPKTFNEKLQWLKLNDRKKEYISLVDKYEVKKIVKREIGSKYIIPTIGVYNSFEEINFENLPNQFVIKCTHDSGGIVIVKDKNKINIDSIKNKIINSLNTNFYYNGREWPYKGVQPRIIVEKYMKDNKNIDLIDYKIMCFNGIPKIIFTCTDRYTDGLKVTFFDTDWNRLPFERHYPSSKTDITKPKHLNKMLELSKKLSSEIPFVRIDWYEINNDIYFGEYTFYPGNGLEEFKPDEWDKKLGDLIDLPK